MGTGQKRVEEELLEKWRRKSSAEANDQRTIGSRLSEERSRNGGPRSGLKRNGQNRVRKRLQEKLMPCSGLLLQV